MNSFSSFRSLCGGLVLILVGNGWISPVHAEDLNQPPDGFVALFNGKDLTGWKGLVGDPKKRAAMSEDELAREQAKADEAMRAHWKVENGIIIYDGKGTRNLCTAKDSGIYLRGSPQVQIWDPEQQKVGSGGLYNNQKHPSKPTAIADNPIGEWNTFYIKMVGERVTVKLNDQLVVDNVVMENYWDRDKPIYSSEAIELQNHGNSLYFRNIYVKELNGQ